MNTPRPTGNLVFALPVLLGLLFSISCRRLPQEEIEERAGQTFLELRLRAAADLNLYDGEASSVALCVYQLSGRTAIDRLRDDPRAMETLLACEQFSDEVAGRERIFLSPGEAKTHRFERRRGARFLAIAAGFHAGDAHGALLLVPLPAVTARSAGRPPPRVGVLLERGRILRDKNLERR